MPYRTIHGDRVAERQTAPGLALDRNSEMDVRVGVVDDVGAAGEGAEGRSAGGDLGGGGKRRKQEEEKKQIPRDARDDSRYFI